MATSSLLFFALATAILLAISLYDSRSRRRTRNSIEYESVSMENMMSAIKSDIRMMKWMLVVVPAGVLLLFVKAYN